MWNRILLVGHIHRHTHTQTSNNNEPTENELRGDDKARQQPTNETNYMKSNK